MRGKKKNIFLPACASRCSARMTFRSTGNKKKEQRSRQGQNRSSHTKEKNANAFMRTLTIDETHHDIVSLHLGFLTGQFLTLQFQTVRQKENVMLEYDQTRSNPHMCTDTHAFKIKNMKSFLTSDMIHVLRRTHKIQLDKWRISLGE